MRTRFILYSLFFILCAASAAPGATPRASDFVNANAYNNMYPAMNNTMRTTLNPGTTPTLLQNPVSAYTRVTDNGGRRVVARPVARTATASDANTAARAGVITAPTVGVSQQPRRVVSRNTAARSGREENSYVYRANQAIASTPESSVESLPADRCLADYIQCMNGYCERKSAAYNKCYCSPRLAQIDAQYQPAIEDLIKQILMLGGTGNWTPAEMNEYWDEMIGVHTGDNSWINLDNSLAIEWADTESRVRGQNAFITGHEYCAQHLRGCYYMAANMRDAYRSDIARDCATYETSLQKIKNAAESIVKNYHE